MRKWGRRKWGTGIVSELAYGGGLIATVPLFLDYFDRTEDGRQPGLLVAPGNRRGCAWHIVLCLAFVCESLRVPRYPLRSKVDGRVSRLPSNLAASAIDKCVRIRNVDVDEPVNASRAASPVHRPPDATDIAGCCVVDPERGTHDAPRLFLAPSGYARSTLCVDGVQGLPVSLGGLLEDLPIEGLLGTIFLSRAFSFSRAFSCSAISGFMPPYFCRQR